MNIEENEVLVEFYFMRHAESMANQKRIASGTGSDSRLSETGEQQTTLAADFLGQVEPGISSVHHTDMHRAFQSASGVNKSLNVPLVTAAAFNEQMLGEWEGASWDEAVIHFLSGEDPPNGESYADFHDRILAGLKELADKKSPDGKIPLIVSHGGVWLAINRMCGVKTQKWPENCDIFRVRLKGSWESPTLETEHVFQLPSEENHSTLTT
ncbi:MAG: histidine phosphatase family protein [Alphaproteobacteria bacterium]|nr:histidine phosphatase family protein [Alphaproteobacteria bacterium]